MPKIRQEIMVSWMEVVEMGVKRYTFRIHSEETIERIAGELHVEKRERGEVKIWGLGLENWLVR